MGRPQFTAPVERPFDESSRTGNVEVAESQAQVAANTSDVILSEPESTFPVNRVSNVSVYVNNWDSGGSGNSYDPNTPGYEVELLDSSDTTTDTYGQVLTAGAIQFDPSPPIPSDGTVKIRLYNTTDVQLSVRAFVVVG
jgi:hypothetical protein